MKTSKGLYEAASHRHQIAGAALALARAELIRARAALELADAEWSLSLELLGQHESKPGIPLYISQQQQAAT